MSGTDTKLTAAVEAYLADLRRVRASGGATGERSSYGPLANLLNAVGGALKPKVFCVVELADQGAGHPDVGLYSAKQLQKGRPREGQTPERGVVEVLDWAAAALDRVDRALTDDLGIADDLVCTSQAALFRLTRLVFGTLTCQGDGFTQEGGY